MKIYKIVTLSLFILLLVNGCNSVEHPFRIEIPNSDINHQISCSLTPGWNTFDWDDILTITLHNNIDEPVIFEYDYNMRIFLLEDNGRWIELENLEEMVVQEDVLLYPDSERPVPVSADYPDTNGEIIVRVYVQGELLPTGVEVVAFIDVKMK